MTRYFEPDNIPEGEEPLFAALKRINRSIEDQARANFNSFIAVDYFLYNGMEKGVGKEKAQQLHRQLWEKYPPIWVKTAKNSLNIGAADNPQDVAKIIEFCQKTRFCNFNISKADDSTIEGEITICPFVEVTQQTFNIPKEDPYFESLEKATEAFIQGIIDQTPLKGKMTVKLESAMCRGGSTCKVICK
ncbi:MAG: hypothetical protein D6734_10655 [Candidatus Schekmanbacteria bacterium]|nr:MAG: hypothetical protein D6734_10655 [Candidatus Schekmanbacteria bacterium]